MKKIIFTLIIILVLSPGLVLAEEDFPGWPMAFYGSATLNEEGLDAGTVILAFSGDNLVGIVEMSEKGIYGYDNPTKSQLLVGEYNEDLLFKYMPAGSSEALAGDKKIQYSEDFTPGEAVELELAFTKAVSSPPSTGGGGSSYRPPAPAETEPATTTEETATTTVNSVEKDEEVKVKGIEYSLNSLYGVAGDIVEEVSGSEAGEVRDQSGSVGMDEANKKIYEKITWGFDLTDEQRYAIAYFIQYGTPTTNKMGAGERAGALNSCVAAFGKFPETLGEWKDVIKVANGRWPSERSEAAENRAKTEFEKIYLREPNMDNPNDNAAVTIMAYGLRPVKRNMDSETAAINTFFAIYVNYPKTANEWDVVRAIACSGASR